MMKNRTRVSTYWCRKLGCMLLLPQVIWWVSLWHCALFCINLLT